MLQTTENWWGRKCGPRDVLRIAIPLVISTMSYTVMQFCDRLFLAWHHTLDLAAVVPAGVLSWTILSIALGTAMYATTFVAQYDGAGQPDRIAAVVWQAIWLCAACAPLFVLIGSLGEPLFRSFGHSEELIWREASYFWLISFGSGANAANAGLGGFWTGRGDTKTVMYVNLVAMAANIALDYPLIFGMQLPFGLAIPEMGIAGAAIATAIAQWLALAIFMLLFLNRHNRAEYSTLANWRLDVPLLKRLLRFGVPNGFQFFIEGGAITVFVLIIAQISDVASAATALAFSINMFVFIPVLGLSFAITTLVGQQIGEGTPELAVRATWTGLVIGLLYTVPFAVAYIVVPHWFLALHQAGADDFGEVEQMARVLLVFVGIYCLIDTVQIMFVSAIKGAGDTVFVVLTTIATATCFLVAGFGLGNHFTDVETQVRLWWVCLTGWIVLLSAAYFLRFRQGKWKTMQVIEPDLV